MGCYGVTDDLNDEINYWKRENKKLLKEKRSWNKSLIFLITHLDSSVKEFLSVSE